MTKKKVKDLELSTKMSSEDLRSDSKVGILNSYKSNYFNSEIKFKKKENMPYLWVE